MIASKENIVYTQRQPHGLTDEKYQYPISEANHGS